MPRIRNYHRPESIDDAVALLSRPDAATAILAGGTSLNADPERTADELVDLQALGLDGVAVAAQTMTIGAMVRLSALIAHPAAPPVVVETALREGPNTLRNVATVGGTVAAKNWESELLASFLVFEAEVDLVSRDGTDRVALDIALKDVNAMEGRIITAVRIRTQGTAAASRTGRTPADTSIVAVVGRRTEEDDIRLAATGVARMPVLIDHTDPGNLNPPTDFRGSAEYRRALATILSRRVLDEIGAS